MWWGWYVLAGWAAVFIVGVALVFASPRRKKLDIVDDLSIKADRRKDD